MADATTDRMTVPRFLARKGSTEKLVVLTAYDFPTARLFDQEGVDALLVGDTLGVVVQGKANTVHVTMDHMVYHTEMVSRATSRALVIGDMPFLSYQVGIEDAVRNAGRLIKEGGAHTVKLEGGTRFEETIRAISRAHIPVMGHIGLTPQSIHKFGRYRVQRDEEQLIADAKAVERAGAYAVVLESVPTPLAKRITDEIGIPTIGIGAGNECDGQVLVWQDALGLEDEFQAKFVQRFAEIGAAMREGVRRFRDDVRASRFPDEKHSYR